jgi:WD40 repeat protein
MDEGRRAARNFQPPRWSNVVGVAVIVGVLVVAGLLGLNSGHGAVSTATPAAGTASDSIPATPAGTGIVARLSLGAYSTFSWSPDGTYLLVSSAENYTSQVYDRYGKLVSQFGSLEGWLDATHLIDGSGYVSDVGTSHTGGPTSNSWVVANGHGSAAIIVAVPGCVGDPIIDWYRDGKYQKTGQKATPFGWSADGKLLLLGHMDCSSQDGEMNGWKGSVDVVDIASEKTVATVSGVRGEMAFSPDGSDLAAQSDSDLKVVDLSSGDTQTIAGQRFLGWPDTESIYAASGSVVNFVDLDPNGIDATTAGVWQAESSTGLHLQGDLTGAATRILAAYGSTLLDLSGAGLQADRYPETGTAVNPWLQPNWWSPDGRMLALRSSDGGSLVLISVDPDKPGAVAS